MTTSSPHSKTKSEIQTENAAPEHDLESIGHHCEYEYCHRLDFLPFKCDSCKQTFCLDHRTETAHKCSHAGEAAAAKRKRLQQSSPHTQLATQTGTLNGGYTLAGSHIHRNDNQKPTVYNSDQCSHPACKTLIHTLKDQGIHCQNCNRDYCLRHRLGEEHDCSKLTPLGPARTGGLQTPQEALRSMFSKVKGWGGGGSAAGVQPPRQQQTTAASTKRSSTSTLAASGLGSVLKSGFSASVKAKVTSISATTPSPNRGRGGSAIIQINELKRTAKGDASIPADKRLYVHVTGPAEADAKSISTVSTSEPPSGNFFFD